MGPSHNGTTPLKAVSRAAGDEVSPSEVVAGWTPCLMHRAVRAIRQGGRTKPDPRARSLNGSQRSDVKSAEMQRGTKKKTHGKRNCSLDRPFGFFLPPRSFVRRQEQNHARKYARKQRNIKSASSLPHRRLTLFSRHVNFLGTLLTALIEPVNS